MSERSRIDPEALLAHRAFVRALVRRLVGDPHDADDVVQETWVAALRGAPARPRSLRAWLARVARNLSLRHARGEARRRRRELGAAAPEAARGPAETLERVAAEHAVVAALLELDEPYRGTLLQHFYDDLAPRAIAARTGVPAATVRTRLKRGLDMLRARLDRRHGGRRAWAAPLAAGTWRASAAAKVAGAAIVALAALLVTWRVFEDTPGPRAERGRDGPRAEKGKGEAGDGDVSGPAAKPAPRPDALALAVRDLGDGAPVSGLTLRFVMDDGREQRVRVDVQGGLTWPRADLDGVARIESGDGAFEVASSPAQAEASGEIWGWRRVSVAGRVHFEGSSDPPFDEVSLRFSPPALTSGGRLGAPGHTGWWRRSARRRGGEDLGAPDDSGRFHVEVPHVRGGAIVARAPGWFPAWTAADPSSELVLVLRRGRRLTGTLHAPDGKQIAYQTVRVFVVQTFRYDELDLAAVGRNKDGGFTLTRSRKDDRSRLKLSYGARTDADGRWSVDLDADGDADVVVHAPDHAAVHARLGPTERLTEEIRLVAREPRPTETLVTRNGEPVRDATLHLIDVTGPAQFGFRTRTNGSGRLDRTEWLAPGRKYGIRTGTGGRAVFFRYHGQPTIDLADCESSFDRFVR